MNAIQPFNFNGHAVRVFEIDGAPWFAALDVALALHYRDASNMLRVLSDDEVNTHKASNPRGGRPIPRPSQTRAQQLALGLPSEAERIKDDVIAHYKDLAQQQALLIADQRHLIEQMHAIHGTGGR